MVMEQCVEQAARLVGSSAFDQESLTRGERWFRIERLGREAECRLVQRVEKRIAR